MTAVYLNTVLCAMLFYTCFCRLVRTSVDTMPGIRLAFVTLASVTTISLMAPFLWSYVPAWPSLMMQGTFFFVQGLTARYWKDGVPVHFQKPSLEDIREVHP